MRRKRSCKSSVEVEYLYGEVCDRYQTFPDGPAFVHGRFFICKLPEGCRNRVCVPALEEHHIARMLADLGTVNDTDYSRAGYFFLRN